jgi:hypothetical protein
MSSYRSYVSSRIRDVSASTTEPAGFNVSEMRFDSLCARRWHRINNWRLNNVIFYASDLVLRVALQYRFIQVIPRRSVENIPQTRITRSSSFSVSIARSSRGKHIHGYLYRRGASSRRVERTWFPFDRWNRYSRIARSSPILDHVFVVARGYRLKWIVAICMRAIANISNVEYCELSASLFRLVAKNIRLIIDNDSNGSMSVLT